MAEKVAENFEKNAKYFQFEKLLYTRTLNLSGLWPTPRSMDQFRRHAPRDRHNIREVVPIKIFFLKLNVNILCLGFLSVLDTARYWEFKTQVIFFTSSHFFPITFLNEN
jgi:hypothetical protein